MKSINNLSMFLAIATMGVYANMHPDRLPASNFGSIVNDTNITKEDVERAQNAWGAALIEISKVHEEKGIKAATQLASKVLDTAYAYNMGEVLFKPTLASGNQTFRINKESALAYFVGSNKKFPEDSGFALKGWRQYAFKNAGVKIFGDTAITMGKVTLLDKNGNITEVDKTWGFKKDSSGQVRIILHHSSLPFQPIKSEVSKL